MHHVGGSNGVFTLAWSGTGTGTGTGKNGLYSFNKNLSHCTLNRDREEHLEHFQDLNNGLYSFNKNLSHCT